MSNQSEIIIWPAGVAERVGLSATTLAAMRLDGDAPKIYAVSPRNLVTTHKDLIDWLETKEIGPGYKLREPVQRRGVK